uniref:Caveolin 1, caveolae protein n=1 Tax=Mus musculus TaxID=10090 RepID=H3BLQ4_MOUSE
MSGGKYVDSEVGLGTSLHCSHPGTGQHLQAQQQGHGRRGD